MRAVNVSEFKAICLRLLDEIRQTGEPIEILKDGRPIAIVHPAPTTNRKSAFGAMKATLAGPLGNLVEPLDENDWEVLRS